MRRFKLGRRARQSSVDAVAQIEGHQAYMDGRGHPELAGAARPMAPGAKVFMTLLLVLGLSVMTILLWSALRQQPEQEVSRADQAVIRNVLPSLNLAPEPTPPAPEPEVPAFPSLFPEPAPALGLDALIAQTDPVAERRLNSGLQTAEVDKNDRSASQAQSQQSESGAMSERLQPVRLAAARAAMMGNRDLWITQGAMIDCVQDPRFVSAQAGMIACYAAHDVRSTSGRVVLIDAGTRFVGYQQGVLAHGQPRIGVIWSRMETPKGVVVYLDSPGTGPLGEVGLDGHIDTHFVDRFGGAILISLMSDIGNVLTARAGRDNGGIRLDATGDAASDAVSTVLENSINIPPTLYRNQGSRIGIYVARDLDFSDVYALRPVSR